VDVFILVIEFLHQRTALSFSNTIFTNLQIQVTLYTLDVKFSVAENIWLLKFKHWNNYNKQYHFFEAEQT
jgi:hypothetical protein